MAEPLIMSSFTKYLKMWPQCAQWVFLKEIIMYPQCGLILPQTLKELIKYIAGYIVIKFLDTVRTTSAEGSSGEGLRQDAQNTSQARVRE